MNPFDNFPNETLRNVFLYLRGWAAPRSFALANHRHFSLLRDDLMQLAERIAKNVELGEITQIYENKLIIYDIKYECPPSNYDVVEMLERLYFSGSNRYNYAAYISDVNDEALMRMLKSTLSDYEENQVWRCVNFAAKYNHIRAIEILAEYKPEILFDLRYLNAGNLHIAKFVAANMIRSDKFEYLYESLDNLAVGNSPEAILDFSEGIAAIAPKIWTFYDDKSQKWHLDFEQFAEPTDVNVARCLHNLGKLSIRKVNHLFQNANVEQMIWLLSIGGELPKINVAHDIDTLMFYENMGVPRENKIYMEDSTEVKILLLGRDAAFDNNRNIIDKFDEFKQIWTNAQHHLIGYVLLRYSILGDHLNWAKWAFNESAAGFPITYGMIDLLRTSKNKCDAKMRRWLTNRVGHMNRGEYKLTKLKKPLRK